MVRLVSVSAPTGLKGTSPAGPMLMADTTTVREAVNSEMRRRGLTTQRTATEITKTVTETCYAVVNGRIMGFDEQVGTAKTQSSVSSNEPAHVSIQIRVRANGGAPGYRAGEPDTRGGRHRK